MCNSLHITLLALAFVNYVGNFKACATMNRTDEGDGKGIKCFSQEDAQSIRMELYVLPDCHDTQKLIANVFGVYDSMQEVNYSSFTLQVTPILCVSEDAQGCSLDSTQFNDKYFALDDGPEINKWGSHLLCFQTKYPEKTKQIQSFMECINDKYDSSSYEICWNQYQSRINPIDKERDCNSVDEKYRSVFNSAAERVDSLVLQESPTLIINGKKYCGSFTYQDVRAAICAATSVETKEVDFSCRKWWNASDDSLLTTDQLCYIHYEPSKAQIIPMLAVLFFVLATLTFVFMLLTRRRLDVVLNQQRRQDASGNRLQELLSILAASRGFADNHQRSAAEIEEALASLKVERYKSKDEQSKAVCPAPFTAQGGCASSPGNVLDTTCTICLEPMKEGDEYYYLDECKHLYHKECLKQWLQKKNECPICRRAILELPEMNNTTSSSEIELPQLQGQRGGLHERVISFTTANGTNITISVSANSQLALSMT